MIRLSKILQTQASSKNYEAMLALVTDYLERLPGVSFSRDRHGNIFAVKGRGPEYPAFACHTDTVHPPRESYHVLRMRKSHTWMAYTIKEQGAEQVGIGGDDKCGIYICLKMLETCENVKCAFFAEEETGCVGSSACDMSFFDDCRYIIQCDRKHNGDIITCGAGTDLCSKEFAARLSSIGERFGYKPTNGSVTDVVTLKERGLPISTVNLSVGYWKPHTKQETIVERDLHNALRFCQAIEREVTERYPHRWERPKQQSFEYSGYYSRGRRDEVRRCAGCNNRLFPSEQKYCYMCDRVGITRCSDCDKEIFRAHEVREGLCERHLAPYSFWD